MSRVRIDIRGSLGRLVRLKRFPLPSSSAAAPQERRAWPGAPACGRPGDGSRAVAAGLVRSGTGFSMAVRGAVRAVAGWEPGVWRGSLGLLWVGILFPFGVYGDGHRLAERDFVGPVDGYGGGSAVGDDEVHVVHGCFRDGVDGGFLRGLEQGHGN